MGGGQSESPLKLKTGLSEADAMILTNPIQRPSRPPFDSPRVRIWCNADGINSSATPTHTPHHRIHPICVPKHPQQRVIWSLNANNTNTHICICIACWVKSGWLTLFSIFKCGALPQLSWTMRLEVDSINIHFIISEYIAIICSNRNYIIKSRRYVL